MNRLHRLSVTLSLFLLAGLAAMAQPANNNFANRIALNGTVVSTTGSNSGATTQTGEPSRIAGARFSFTVWWSWTAPASGPVRIDTLGSSFDTLLGVYTGALNSLALVADNNNGSGLGTASLVTFNAVQGTEYEILVASQRNGASGAISLQLAMLPSVSISSPADGAVVAAGNTFPLVAAASSPNGAISRVDFYRAGTLIGSVTAQPYSMVVSNSPLGTNSYLAVATDSLGKVSTSAAVRVASLSLGVTITSPTDGTVFLSNGPITVSTVTLVQSGSITNVEFFVDRLKFAETGTSPFSATWIDVTPGAHFLTAVGKDNGGNLYTSAPSAIAVAWTLVPTGAVWKYLDNGSDQGTAWVAPTFDDSLWLSGPAELGYGDDDAVPPRPPATLVGYGPDANNKYITTYFRTAFVSTNAASFTNLVLHVLRDDGAVIYLNGVEAARYNMPAGTIDYLTLAPTTAADDGTIYYPTNVSPSLLAQGTNVVAVEIHQEAVTSSDISFDMALLGVPIIPRNQAPLVNLAGPTNNATFQNPVTVTITGTASDADGSVAVVEFFADGVKLGQSTSSAFSFAWVNPPAGWHTLQARATDDQGATGLSQTIGIIVYESDGRPLVRLTTPPNGAVYDGPTNLTVTAEVSTLRTVTNVQFRANGLALTDDRSSPYRFIWNNATYGTNALTAIASDSLGLRGTSAVVTAVVIAPPTNTYAPTIYAVKPVQGATIGTLTSIQVTFSEIVIGVDAGDLLVNGTPAVSVTGSGSNYTFAVTEPPLGAVAITWAEGHGIEDIGYPSRAFDATAPGATWNYNLADITPPTIVSRTPAAGATVANLTQVAVAFSEPVTGVDAADLLINGTPAVGLGGSGSNYTFSFAQPPSGVVGISWAVNHGITDLAPSPNPFNASGLGATWNYTLDARTVLVDSNANWMFIKGFAEASTPMDAWRFPGFDDSSWSNAPAPFFYGDTGYTNALHPGTYIGDMLGGAYSCIFLRNQFVIPSVTSLTNLYFNAQSDDGFIAWINGVEVLRYNMATGDIPYNGAALTAVTEPNNNGAGYILYTLTDTSAYLVDGTNVLTVQAFNNQPLTSSDFGFNAQFYTYMFVGTLANIITPADNTTFYLPTNVSISASAASTNGVTNVQFFADSLLLGARTASPYNLTWTNPPLGSHVLMAVAWDSAGMAITSAVVNVSVLSNDVPYVKLTNPSQDTVALAPANFMIMATATDLVGVARVEFYANSSKLGQSTTSPYLYAWAGVPASTNQIYAVATDNLGLSATSAVVTIRVTNDAPPVVALTSPTNGQTIAGPANISMTATASDADGTIALVEFFAAGSKVGESASAPYSTVWSNVLESGIYSLYAIATDNLGLRGTSAMVNITFNGDLRPLVSLTNPTNGASFVAGQNIPLQAAASDPDGTVTNVEFYASGSLLGSVSTLPYNLTWTNAAAGNYVLSAVAVDNLGLRGTSAPVNISVASPAVPLLITYDFSTLPDATNWSTYAMPGAAGNLTTSAQLEAAVEALTASQIFAQLNTANANPPAAAGPATWSAPGGYVQTRPTGIDATALMCTLFNDSRGPVGALDIAYDYATVGTAGIAEEVPGHLVYYSLTGAANSWVNIPELSLQPAGRLSTTLNLPSSWAADTKLYLLWADDNGSGSPDWAIQIDNFQVSDNNQPRVQITSPANNSLVVLPTNAVLEATISHFSNAVTTVAFYVGTSKLGDDPTSPYSVIWTNSTPGQYVLRAVATDNAGLSVTSAPVNVRVQNNLPPAVAITSPEESAVFGAPADILITVSASDSDGAVTNVEFYANGLKIGQNGGAPFNFTWSGVAVGSYAVTAVAWDNQGAAATSSVVRVFALLSTAPTVDSFAPASGVVSNLTQITVNFTQPVNGVDAADLLVNGVPATSVTGANATYTFYFPPPLEGVVAVTWAANHGIVNRLAPPQPFSGIHTNETTQYTLIDTVPPVVTKLGPVAGTLVPGLTQVEVTFNEPVGGVTDDALLVNGVPASKVSGSLAGPYLFEFAQPPNGLVQLAWAAGHGIHDLSLARNPFAGGAWTYTLNTNAVLSGMVVINEIMYQPYSGNDADEWVELYNTTGNVIDLSGWRFSKGFNYTFSNYLLPAHGYVVVCASLAAFQAGHAGVANAVGDWVGRLSNIDEILELQDANGQVINKVHYADEGDWAMRVSGNGDLRAFNLTSSGTTATLTTMGIYVNGDQMTISGADQAAYNGTYSIAGTTWNGGPPVTSFTYIMSSSAASPATGYIQCRQLTDHSVAGWAWSAPAHGFGRTLELCNPGVANDNGQNWRASAVLEGTPGQANSVLTNNLPPIISDVAHYPAVPKAADTVLVTARLLDEQATGLSATLFYRNASTTSPGAFLSVAMFDDGLHGDGVANDGVFAGSIPPQANGAIMEFYVLATDGQGLSRTWPGAAVMGDGSLAQSANALYQVDDSLAPASAANQTQPFYRLIMTATERQRMSSLSTDADAAMNATFVSTENGRSEIRYNTDVRIRGAGSRGRAVKNYRVNIPSDRRWRGVREINLNTQFIHSQLAGSTLAARAGMPAAHGRVVQVRMNGANLASSLTAEANWSQNGQGDGFGSYYHLEALNADWASSLLPDNSGGSVYRGSRYPWTANLDYLLGSTLVTNTGLNFITYVNHGYTKASNHGENDWTDLYRLSWALTMVPGDTEYVPAVNAIANVPMCMRYFALCNALDYRETSMCTGVGDDYAMYCGTTDPRFTFLPHDFDTILGLGDSGAGSATRSIWVMLDSPFSTDPTMQAKFEARFLRHPQFAPIYLREQRRICDTVFTPEIANPLLDEILGGWVPDATISTVKSFVAQRRASIYAQLPLTFSVTVPLTITSGYYRSTLSSVTLNGTYNSLDASSVVVGGLPAVLSPWQGRWTNTVALQPGINHVVIDSRDSNNVTVATTNVDIWFDQPGQSVSGTISGTVVWNAANGPYNVTGSITVGNGATLNIQPGTTVFFASGTTLTVSGSGQVLAEGTAAQHIRLARVPGAGNWGSFDFIGATNESRLVYVDFEGCAGTTISGHDAEVHANNSKVFFDHLVFPNTPAQEYLSFDDSSFIVQNSVFPTYPFATSAPEMLHGVNGIPVGGYGIFRDNYFGHTWGFNDTIDFTGGQRPGAILQILNNVFDGAGDDNLDLDSTDAWIEGNIFMHVHRDTNRTDTALDTGSAISGGVDFANQFSEWTVLNNLFYDVDHVILNKGGGSPGAGRFIFVNNTVAHVNKENGAGLTSDIAAFDFTDDNVALPDPIYGAGAYIAGNIIWDCPMLTANYNPANHTVVFENNILPMPWTGPGSNNVVVDPLLNLSLITNVLTADWKTVKAAFMPRTGSPALGTGLGGFDKGGLNPKGLLVFGEPQGMTRSTSATLTVAPGGAFHWGSVVPPYTWGYTNYKWKLDDGSWSAGTSIFTSPTISLTGLSEGAHTVYVAGLSDAGYSQDDTFVYPATAGIPAHITASSTWIVNTNALLLRLNEILARNDAAVPVNGKYPDLIELYNAGTSAVDLSGMGLTDNPADAQKYVFPPGTSLGAGKYLVLYADTESTPAGYHLGFALNQEGEEVSLFSATGQLVDSVTFGPQLANLSIGRLADGSWALTQPTFGEANQAAATGDPHRLKINEWLASGSLFPYDFIELWNGDTLPVELGGLFLTDNAIGAPSQHEIAPLSFVPGNGYAVFIADADTGSGPTHLNFKLSSDRGTAALFDQNLVLIDYIIYGPQRTDISQGRIPNGGSNIVFLAEPTPGAGNRATLPPVGTQLVINEVMAHNVSGLTNLDGSTPEWIELYNPTANLINLAGMSLSDDQTLPQRFVFPAGATLAAGGYRVILCDGSQPASTNLTSLYLNTGFGIKASGGGIYLYDQAVAALDWINYGLQGADYSIGRVYPGGTNWALSLPTPGSANITTGVGDPMQLRINEWMAAPSAGSDWFEVYNPGAQPVAVSGFYLANDLSPAGLVKNAPLPPLSFIGAGPSGYQQFWADKSPASGADHVNFKLSASGESIGLANSNGLLIDGITFGPQAADVSQGRLPDGATNVVSFPATPTPGDGNYLLLADAVINEVLSNPTSSALEQAIELLNLSGSPLNLGGWYLSNTKRALNTYRIPDGTILPPGGFKVFYQYQFYTGPQSASFLLDGARGDNVYLSQADANGNLTGYRAVQNFGAADPNVSFGRYVNSATNVDFVAMIQRTFGHDTPATVADFRLGQGAANANPLVGPVVFSEIMYHPLDLPGPVDNVRDEFLELYNLTSTTVALYDPAHLTNTWRLRGGADFDFPPGVSLTATQRLLVVSFDPVNDTNALAGFKAAYPQLPSNALLYGPYSGKLANGGERVEIQKPGSPVSGYVPYILVEGVHYHDKAPWDVGADGTGLSLQRLTLAAFGNEPTNWVASMPTPGLGVSLNPDSDGDGIPDWWMVKYFGHPTGQLGDHSMAYQDADGDGMSNLDEYSAGTDPKNPDSLLKLDGRPPVVAGDSLTLVVEVVANLSYTIEYTDGLNPADWQRFYDINPAPANRVVEVPVTAGPAQRFYRVRTPRLP